MDVHHPTLTINIPEVITTITTIENAAKCGAPPVDWAHASDAKAPVGWHVVGFTGDVGNGRKCKNGWNAYANGGNQGQLSARMTGSGIATVQ